MHPIHLMSTVCQHHDVGDGCHSSSKTHQGVVGSNHLGQISDVDAAGNLVANQTTGTKAANHLQDIIFNMQSTAWTFWRHPSPSETASHSYSLPEHHLLSCYYWNKVENETCQTIQLALSHLSICCRVCVQSSQGCSNAP